MDANGSGRGCGDLREIVMDVVLEAGDAGVTRFDQLLERAGRKLETLGGLKPGPRPFSIAPGARLPPGDAERALDIVWDLARRGLATFSPDASARGFPGVRRARAREREFRPEARSGPDRGSMKSLPLDVAEISHDSIAYFREAVAAFYMERLLAATVTLALAAEVEFLRLLGAAQTSAAYGGHFSRIGDARPVAARVAEFRAAMAGIRAQLPADATAELDLNLEAIQCVMRAARDDAGRPRGAPPPARDQVYRNLRGFLPFARQARRLRRALDERPALRLARLR